MSHGSDASAARWAAGWMVAVVRGSEDVANADAPNAARAIARATRSMAFHLRRRGRTVGSIMATSSVAVPPHGGAEAASGRRGGPRPSGAGRPRGRARPVLGRGAEGDSSQRPALAAAAVAGPQLGEGSV